MSRSLTLLCARCRRPAATFSLLAAGEGEGLGRDRDRIERTGFMGTTTKFGELESYEPLLKALERGDYPVARQNDPDFVAFHCWQCGQDYCEQCWRVGPPEFDEGFYDCTRATCPAGHEQMVDD